MKRKNDLTIDTASTQEELDLLRAKERAGLKHTKGSAWKRRMQLLSKKIPQVKEALIAHNETGKKLMNETKGQLSNSEDEPLDYVIDTGEKNEFENKLTTQEKINLANNPWLTEEVKKDKVFGIYF